MAERTPEQITDEFLNTLQKGNFKINPKAIYKGSFPALNDAKDDLIDAIDDFTELRYIPNKTEDLHKAAITCVLKINNAWIQNLLKEKPNTGEQLKKIQQENFSLKEVNNRLAKENDHLKKQITTLHETIDRITAKGLNKASDGNP